ncbi:HAD family hydrolase [Treponema sp.]|uniref:HAD family hydrolase n=1 Tax=Treponema sp. TaxID=166 RepID=UPI00388FBA06
MKNSIFTNMKCAIFDMDGTILDSMGMWHGIGAQYLAANGKTPREGLWDEIKRFNLVESADYFIEKYQIKKSQAEIMDEIRALISGHYGKTLQLKEGARELLEKLNEKHIPCVLATATDRPSVIACMERLDCVKYFKAILTCLEFNTTKTEPLIFEKAAEVCGAKNGESVVFEDALHAIRTAKKAGFKVCAVYDESNEEKTEPPLTDWQRILELCDADCKNLNEFELS